MLLCDTDHGLVHDHDLVLSRRNGALIVLTPDGRRIWGTADAAFAHRTARRRHSPAADPAGSTDPFVGVHPIDTAVGRRPTDAPPPGHDAQAPPPPGDRCAADRARRDAHQPADPPNGAPPPPADTPAGPDARPPGGQAASPPPGQPPRWDRLDRAPG